MGNEFILPDGERILLSQILEIGEIVDVPKSIDSEQNIIGFSINYKNGNLKNITYIYNDNNKKEIKNILLKIQKQLKKQI